MLSEERRRIYVIEHKKKPATKPNLVRHSFYLIPVLKTWGLNFHVQKNHKYVFFMLLKKTAVA